MNTTKTSNNIQPTASAESPVNAAPEAIAVQLIGLLDQFESLVPGFQPHDAGDVHRVATAARFASELIQPTITAVSSFAPASERKMFDIERGKAALQYRDAFRPVAQRQMAEAGTEALQAYAWAKTYAKSPGGAGLRPYLDEMRRVVRRALNRRKPAATTPAPAPAPPAQGFLASNLVPGINGEDDLPEDFRKALDAVS